MTVLTIECLKFYVLEFGRDEGVQCKALRLGIGCLLAESEF